MTVTPSTPATISPKVIAPVVFNLALIVLVAVLAAVTPDMLLGLGQFGVLVYVALSTLGTALTGYITRDPARS